MNYISVIAHGAPGSFVRTVQHDPHRAALLLAVCRNAATLLDANPVANGRAVASLLKAAIASATAEGDGEHVESDFKEHA